jgi:hypothetical protein
MAKIDGGYYIKARAIQKSSIMRQPPHVREIWDYLLMNANHTDRIYNGNLVKRGQIFRSYQQIRDDLAWFIGWRKETYSENHTKKAMRFLRESLMVATTKELGGVLVTICNYDFYQDPKNYERTNESTIERTIEEPSKNQPLPYTNKNGKNLKNEEQFKQFYSAYPRKVSKEPSRKAFVKLNPSDELFVIIMNALDEHKKAWDDINFIPHPSTWINQKRWEDEIITTKSQLTAEQLREEKLKNQKRMPV